MADESWLKPQMSPEQLDVVLAGHREWVESGGVRGTRAELVLANLSKTNLFRQNLFDADLTSANLAGATLSDAILTGANLSNANLTGVTLTVANLSGANLLVANLSGASLAGANLTGANLKEAKLDGADLRSVQGLRLDNNFVRNAQFSPVASRLWAHLSNSILAPLQRWFGRSGQSWLARRTDYPEIHNDSWSILRQLYSGPRTLFLFFFVVIFALPYVGRAAFYSTASAAEQKVIDSWTHQKDHWREPHRAVGGPAAEVIATPFDGAERFVRRNSQPRPLWQVLLKIDEGRILPSLLAVLLVLYNVGVYWLITAVGPLRDEEERSGWSPAWKDYGYLRWVHRFVTGLFYVSFAAFLWNVAGLLRQTVWVPAGG